MSYLSSSETTCQLNECAQPPCQCLPVQTTEIGDTHVYFIRSMAPTPKSEPSELQIEIQKRVYVLCISETFITRMSTHYGMGGMALSNTSSITLQMSGINVLECVCLC